MSKISFEILNFGLLGLTLSLIILVTYSQLQLPQRKLHISLSEVIILYAILMYSVEIAVLLAFIEAVYASFSLIRKGTVVKGQTILLNSAIASITAFVSGIVAAWLFPLQMTTHNYDNISAFVIILTTIAATQFIVNTVLVTIFATARTEKTFFKIWRENWWNSLLMYVVCGAITGFFTKAVNQIDTSLIIATFVIGLISYLTYRRYVNDIRETSAKAEQAERERAEQAEKHIEELKRHIAQQEETEKALRQSKENFRHAAFHDALTDLPNRNHFIDTLKFLLEKSKETEEFNFAVMFLDLNRFKTINDSLGHSVGDQLILHVAKRLSNLVHDGDLVARFSGDEFAVILTNIKEVHDAIKFAELIQHKFSTPFAVGKRQIFTSISIGITLNHPNYQEAEDILRDADIAMYHAKESEREYIIFDQSMHTRAVTLLQLETDLRYAIERNELCIYFQPIVTLDTVQLVGFEALVRWNHPQRGVIPPSEFISVSEETGFIVPLTLWILRNACRQLVEWQSKSPINKSLIVSVNLSGKHFTQPDLVEQIDSILKETDLSPECLKLEITESAVMQKAESVISMLKEIRKLGVQLSIDDFGTGYSSLSYLHRFPINTLKIDRSFVCTMENGSENGEIVRTIIALAKALGMSIVAEGIETIHQLHQLRILGCEYGQGYLFSRPVPGPEAELILDDRNRWENIIPKHNFGPVQKQPHLDHTHLRLAK